MFHKLVLIFILISVVNPSSEAQVRVRIFSDRAAESVLFTVNNGKYEIDTYGSGSLTVIKGDMIIISRFNEKIAVKPRNSKGFLCDSILVKETTDDGSFSIRINGNVPVRQYYTGNLNCYPDMGTLVMINSCDIEEYIAGVVRAEGGTGNSQEYIKTQAVIVRTYMYKNFNKHFSDGFNLCDNTHCQVFNGISTDSSIVIAARKTHNLVILDQDSVLVFSAFHSNCGGETSNAEDVWLSSQPYLKKVKDPYCLTSRNARWQKSFSSDAWIDYLKRSGFSGNINNLTFFNFEQYSRLPEYTAGSFAIPLRTMRSDLNLRSSFFSVTARGDSIILNGRGYGHGVGLCQEGAMVMAANGFDYKHIIDFYYTGVIISDINSAVEIPPNPPFGAQGGLK